MSSSQLLQIRAAVLPGTAAGDLRRQDSGYALIAPTQINAIKTLLP